MAATNPTARVRAILVSARLWLIATVLASSAHAQLAYETPTTCDLEATLQPATRRVIGVLRLTAHNASNRPLDVVSFWLPPSGSADEFGLATTGDELGPARPGTLEIVSAAQLSDGGSVRQLQPRIERYQPRRLLVPLMSPLPAGGSLKIQLRFRCHLRDRRAALAGDVDSFVCTGWYPELDRRELGLRTRTTIRARLDAPERFVLVASGGTPAIQADSIDGTKRVLTVELVDADRLAFVADSTLVVRERTLGPFVAADDATGAAQAIAAQRGVDVASLDLPELVTRVCLPGSFASVDRFDRYFRAVRVAYEYFGLRTGGYPGDGLTVVGQIRDVPVAAQHASGWVVASAPAVMHARSLQPERALLAAFGRSFTPPGAGAASRDTDVVDALVLLASARLEQLEYAPTIAPVFTTPVGGLVFAATASNSVGGLGIHAASPALPLALIVEWLPGGAAEFVRDAGFSGRLVPQSPLLELMETQPTAVLCKEVRTHGPLELRQRWLATDWASTSSSRPIGADPLDDLAGIATLMWSLEQLAGPEPWRSFVRALRVRRERGLAPLTDEVVAALLVEHTNRGIAEFYRVANQPNAIFDYGIDSIQPSDGKGVVKSVVLRRTGTLRADVRVRFRFAGRSLPVVRVFGAGYPSATRRFTFDDAAGLPFGDLLQVEVDPPLSAGGLPFGSFPIDRNLLDNAWCVDADHEPAAYRAIRALLQAQSRLSFAGIIG